jgi:hypothetical protein
MKFEGLYSTTVVGMGNPRLAEIFYVVDGTVELDVS